MLEEQVELLQSECDNLEQYSRRCNLMIHGIPESGEGEDTTLKVLELVNVKMAVPPVAKEDIVVRHRLGKQRDTGNRPVQTLSYSVKSQLVGAHGSKFWR